MSLEMLVDKYWESHFLFLILDIILITLEYVERRKELAVLVKSNWTYSSSDLPWQHQRGDPHVLAPSHKKAGLPSIQGS